MGTTTTIESQRALAWIVRQLSWERTLETLRIQATATAPVSPAGDDQAEEKVAA